MPHNNTRIIMVYGIGKTDIKLIIESKYKEEREQKLYWHVYVKLHLMGN